MRTFSGLCYYIFSSYTVFMVYKTILKGFGGGRGVPSCYHCSAKEIMGEWFALLGSANSLTVWKMRSSHPAIHIKVRIDAG